MIVPLCSTESTKLINKSDILTQIDPNNIDLHILKGSLDIIIPQTIYVNCVSSNTNLNSDLHVFKLAKHRFPHTDVSDPSSDSRQYSKMQILENILNISVCNLNSTNYQVWSELAQRDVHYKEITALGLRSTKYDIKMKICRF